MRFISMNYHSPLTEVYGFNVYNSESILTVEFFAEMLLNLIQR